MARLRNPKIRAGNLNVGEHMKTLLLLFITLTIVSCSPEQSATDYSQVIKPLAGDGVLVTTPEETPVSVSYFVDKSKNPKAVDLTWVLVTPPKYGELSDCDKQKLSLTCTYTPNKDFNGDDKMVLKNKDGDFISSESSEIVIRVTAVPDAPKAAEDLSKSVPENTVIEFYLNEATDVDSKDLSYEIINENLQGGELECDPQTRLCAFIGAQDFFGTVSFDYIAIDDSDLETEQATKVDIRVMDYPQAGADQNINVMINMQRQFNVNLGSDGDSQNLSYELGQSPSNGSLFNCFEKSGDQLSCEYRPNLGFEGMDSFTYYVVDEDGLKSKAPGIINLDVRRPNSPPMVGANQNLETDEETALTFDVSRASDADHRDLTSEAPLSYHLSTMPQNGTLSCFTMGMMDRKCTYTPNAGFYDQTDSFTYYVKDEMDANSLMMATVNIKVNYVNRPPRVGADQTEEVTEDMPKVITVNAGTDFEHTDPNTEAELNYYIEDMPQYGTLSDCFDNKVDFTAGQGNENARKCTYTPDAGVYDQADSFTYYVKDAEDRSVAVATVSINIIEKNDAPKVGDDQEYRLENYFDQTAPFDFYVNSGTDDQHKDPNTEPVLQYIVVDQPQYGVLTNCFGQVDFSDASGDMEDRKCTYTPNIGEYGKDDFFTYKVMDSELESVQTAKVTFELVRKNYIPKVGADQTEQTEEEEAVVITVNAGTDQDHTDPNTEAELNYYVEDMPQYGKLSDCFENQVDFTAGQGNPNARMCTYTPDPGQYDKDDTFTYYVKDQYDRSVEVGTVTISIEKKNRIPKVGADQNLEVEQDSELEFTVSAGTDEDHTDPNTDAELQYVLVDQPMYGTITCFAPVDFTRGYGLPEDRMCTYTPDAGEYDKTDKITYYVMDQEDQSVNVATVNIQINKKNNIPVVGADQMEMTDEETAITITMNPGTDLDHMDPNTDAELNYYIATMPQNGVLSNCFENQVDFTRGYGLPEDRMCTYTPNAGFYDQTDSFTYYVMDFKDMSVATATVTIQVNYVNRPPKVGEDQEERTDEETAIIITMNPGTDYEHTDPNTDAELNYYIKDMPQNGVLSNCFLNQVDFTRGYGLPEDRQCTYTPNAGFYNQEDSFTYYVMDSEDPSVEVATVRIYVDKVNRIPKVGADQTFAVVEGVQYDFLVSVGTDEDHMDPNTAAELNYIIMTQPQYGTLDPGCFPPVDFNRGYGLEEDRKCGYTANVGAVAMNGGSLTDSFTYYVMDQMDRSVEEATVTFTVSPANAKPVVGDDQNEKGYINLPLSFEVNEGSDNETATENLTYKVIDPPMYGQLNTECLKMPAPDQRKCQYQPDPDWKGDDFFTYKVVDENGNESENVATVYIEITDKPVVVAQSNCEKATADGTLKTMTYQVTFPALPGGSCDFYDPNNPSVPDASLLNAAGNGGRFQAFYRARAEQEYVVNLPTQATLCGASFDFPMTQMVYDDEIYLTLNDYMLAMSVDVSQEAMYDGYSVDGLMANSEGFYKYQWHDTPDANGMYNLPMTFTPDRYCLGVAKNDPDFNTKCVIPPTQTVGQMKLDIPDESIIAVGALTDYIDPKDPNMVGQPTQLNFGFISTGDNDIAIDCSHSEVQFTVTVKYVDKR